MKQFFTCLDKCNTDAAKWLRGLKNNMEKIGFDRDVKDGKKIDNSATPLYHEEMSNINAAYARANTPESAVRKFSIAHLWSAAGRSSEAAFCNLDGMQWDTLHQCVFVEYAQIKVSRVKLIACVAGATRHLCWFLNLADYMAVGHRFVHDEVRSPRHTQPVHAHAPACRHGPAGMGAPPRAPGKGAPVGAGSPAAATPTGRMLLLSLPACSVSGRL